MTKAGAWVILLVIGIIFIIGGARGRIGSVMAALVTPSQLA